jgi:uncharacterized protein with von Willebrand factor type A (vWA) domain
MAQKNRRSSISKLTNRGARWFGRLPESYRKALIEASLVDSLEATACGLLGWRDALLQGRVPQGNHLWPAGAIGDRICAWFESSGILPHCKDNHELVDLVVLELLKTLLEAQRKGLQRIEKLLRQWLEKEQKRREEAAQPDLNTDTVMPLSVQERERERKRITLKVDAEAGDKVVERLEKIWSSRIAAWNSVYDVFGEMGRQLKLGWDLSRGVLKLTGWEDVVRIHNLIKRLPQISEIARTIGRLREAESEEVAETRKVMKAISRVVEEQLWVKIPTMRNETDGVQRSADVQRMLAAESMLMRHPTFRKLWKAKLLERGLATYRVVGYGYESVKRHETEYVETEEVTKRRLDRGPIVACLDTSGSMQGVPEMVAKAITFELMRLAAAESRKCFLYTFSGPGDLEGKELSLTPDGLKGIIDLLSMSFDGGTDISAPMRAAVTKVSQAGWSRADIVMVSDGEFRVPPEIQALVDEAKRNKGLRIHGLIVHEHDCRDGAMRRICDPLHQFRDWSSVRGL